MATPHFHPGTTVLVVDDERALRRAVYRALDAAGYRVFEAASGAEAMEILELAYRYVHIVLLDVVLPVESGVQLGARIAARWPCIRLLYTSAYPRAVLLEHGLEPQHLPFLEKPFAMPKLVERIEQVLDRPPVYPHPG